MAFHADDLHHFDVAAYLRLAGVERESFEHTELVGGVVLDVSPESWLHAETVRRIDELLDAQWPNRSRRNGSVRFVSDSLWAPDVYVLRPGAVIDHYPLGADLEVVVEVAVSTIARDLGPKRDVYARHGVPSYFVIEPAGNRYRVHENRSPEDGRFRFQHTGWVDDLTDVDWNRRHAGP